MSELHRQFLKYYLSIISLRTSWMRRIFQLCALRKVELNKWVSFYIRYSLSHLKQDFITTLQPPCTITFKIAYLIRWFHHHDHEQLSKLKKKSNQIVTFTPLLFSSHSYFFLSVYFFVKKQSKHKNEDEEERHQKSLKSVTQRIRMVISQTEEKYTEKYTRSKE